MKKFYIFTLSQLFYFNLYFGYPKIYLNASTNFLLLGYRNNLCIFNLNITLLLLKITFSFLFNLYFRRGLVWVIENIYFYKLINYFFNYFKTISSRKKINKKSTKQRQIISKLLLTALYLKIFFFRNVWVFGILSNYKNVSNQLLLQIHNFLNLKKLKKKKILIIFLSKFFLKKKFNILYKYYNKQNLISYNKININFVYHKQLNFLKKANKIAFPYPSAVFFFEQSANELKIKESNCVSIPSISVISNNSDKNLSTYIISSNENGFKVDYFYYKLILLFFIRNIYYNILLFKHQVYKRIKKC